MEIKQVATFVNAAFGQATGNTAVVSEDLSDVITAGKNLFAAGDNVVDNYVKALYDVTGKQVVVDRVYKGVVPSLLRTRWEFGSVLQKIRMDIPDAVDNPAWQLVNGQSYDQDKFYQPAVHQKVWNFADTFMVPLSITEMQVKESFLGAQQMNAFVSMLYTGMANGITKRTSELIRRAINNMIAETIYDDYQGGSLSGASHVKAVNLLYEYNQIVATPITAADALTTPEFLRYASMRIKQYISRLRDMSELFNISGTVKFTPADLQHVVMLADFEAAASVYLYNGTGQFLVDNIQLPYADTVNYWQGTGTDYSFTNISKIDVVSSEGNTVQAGGILACIFDHDAVAVCNEDTKTLVHRNELGEFTNNFAKVKLGLVNDFDENFVVFFVA